jgi:carboxyl-terminal processing protease
MPRRNVPWVFGTLLLTFACWIAAQGGLAAPRGPLSYIKGLPGSYQDYENLSLFIDVMQVVEQYYVHELTPEERRKFVENAVQAALQGLDDHSAFLNPKDYRQYEKISRGSFGGIGVQISVSRDTKRITIVSPIVGTPAYHAGLKPGDEIEEIDGVSTLGMSSEDAVERITGQPGTQIKLKIRSKATSRTRVVTLTRAVIEVDSVMGDQRDAERKWDFLLDHEQKIGYIRLTQFGIRAVDEMKTALEQLKQRGARALVLDLRGNPGGHLTAAVEITNLFLASGRIVSIEGRQRPHDLYDAKPDQLIALGSPDYPLAVLIDSGSASASEIVAAALQDAKRALLVGERTFGKGSVQNMIPLEGGNSAVKVTTAKYLRPSGKNIHRFPMKSKETDDWGVRPDVEVKLTPRQELDWFLARRDRDIVRVEPSAEERAEAAALAVGALGTTLQMALPGGSVLGAADLLRWAEEMPAPPRPFHDPVRDKAVEILRQRLAAANANAAR